MRYFVENFKFFKMVYDKIDFKIYFNPNIAIVISLNFVQN